MINGARLRSMGPSRVKSRDSSPHHFAFDKQRRSTVGARTQEPFLVVEYPLHAATGLKVQRLCPLFLEPCGGVQGHDGARCPRPEPTNADLQARKARRADLNTGALKLSLPGGHVLLVHRVREIESHADFDAAFCDLRESKELQLRLFVDFRDVPIHIDVGLGQIKLSEKEVNRAALILEPCESMRSLALQGNGDARRGRLAGE